MQPIRLEENTPSIQPLSSERSTLATLSSKIATQTQHAAAIPYNSLNILKQSVTDSMLKTLLGEGSNPSSKNDLHSSVSSVIQSLRIIGSAIIGSFIAIVLSLKARFDLTTTGFQLHTEGQQEVVTKENFLHFALKMLCSTPVSTVSYGTTVTAPRSLSIVAQTINSPEEQQTLSTCVAGIVGGSLTSLLTNENKAEDVSSALNIPTTPSDSLSVPIDQSTIVNIHSSLTSPNTSCVENVTTHPDLVLDCLASLVDGYITAPTENSNHTNLVTAFRNVGLSETALTVKSTSNHELIAKRFIEHLKKGNSNLTIAANPSMLANEFVSTLSDLRSHKLQFTSAFLADIANLCASKLITDENVNPNAFLSSLAANENLDTEARNMALSATIIASLKQRKAALDKLPPDLLKEVDSSTTTNNNPITTHAPETNNTGPTSTVPQHEDLAITPTAPSAREDFKTISTKLLTDFTVKLASDPDKVIESFAADLATAFSTHVNLQSDLLHFLATFLDSEFAESVADTLNTKHAIDIREPLKLAMSSVDPSIADPSLANSLSQILRENSLIPLNMDQLEHLQFNLTSHFKYEFVEDLMHPLRNQLPKSNTLSLSQKIAKATALSADLNRYGIGGHTSNISPSFSSNFLQNPPNNL